MTVPISRRVICDLCFVSARSQQRYVCFFIPSETRSSVEPLILRYVAWRDLPNGQRTLIKTDGLGSYHWLGRETLSSDKLFPNRPKLFEHEFVIHKHEFVTADGVHTNNVEGRNAHIKSMLKGSYALGTSHTLHVPDYIDFGMYRCNWAWQLTDCSTKLSTATRLKQLFISIMFDIGFFYDPGQDKSLFELVNGPGNFCTDHSGGPWLKDEWDAIVGKNIAGDVARGDGFDQRTYEYEPSMGELSSDGGNESMGSDFTPADLGLFDYSHDEALSDDSDMSQ
jgi:hypothetical protein